MKTCSKCKTTNANNAQFCCNCGASLAQSISKFCSQCGTQIPEFSSFCPTCGQQIRTASGTSNAPHTPQHHSQQYSSNGMPDTHMTKSIISLLLCLLCGIPALIYSNKVEKLWMSGNKYAAQEASQKADTFGTIGIVLGIVSWIGSIASFSALFG